MISLYFESIFRNHIHCPHPNARIKRFHSWWKRSTENEKAYQWKISRNWLSFLIKTFINQNNFQNIVPRNEKEQRKRTRNEREKAKSKATNNPGTKDGPGEKWENNKANLFCTSIVHFLFFENSTGNSMYFYLSSGSGPSIYFIVVIIIMIIKHFCARSGNMYFNTIPTCIRAILLNVKIRCVNGKYFDILLGKQRLYILLSLFISI